MQHTADSLITRAVDMLDDRYAAQPGRREGRAATRARPELKKEPPMDQRAATSTKARDWIGGLSDVVPARAPGFNRTSPGPRRAGPAFWG